MKLTDNENVFYTDIDETLVMTNYTSSDELIEFDYYGEKRFLRENKGHTSFLKALKQRGYYIIAHSGNGGKWAYEVCTKLGLTDIIDECKTKPTRMLDDSDDWIKIIYIPENR